MSKVRIGSGMKNSNCGFPIGSGLIFLSDTLDELQHSSYFSQMELVEYQRWRKLRASYNEPIQAWEPVGCFEFNTNEETLTFNLDVVKDAFYVLLKPTNFRKVPYDNSMHFKNNPLEIKLF